MKKYNISILIFLSCFFLTIDKAFSQDDVSFKDHLSIDNRIYAGDDSAFGSLLKYQYNNFSFGLGGYFYFNDEQDHIKPKLDVSISRMFPINDDININLGVGSLNVEPYVDYNFEYLISNKSSLLSGYRFHFDEDSESRNQFYLGFTYKFGLSDKKKVATGIETGITQSFIEEKNVNEEKLNVKIGHIPFGKIHANYGDRMDELAQALVKNRGIKIDIIGHTDSLGSDDFNIKLSKERAKSAGDYLISKGVNKEQIHLIGKGESMPIATNETIEGRSENRRVQIKIL